MRDVMTPEQVAEHHQVSTDTVYRLIRNRELAASKVGRAYRVRREDLDKFLALQSTEAEVREWLFERASRLGKRNARRFPDLTSDQVLDELEAMDDERTQARADRR